MGFAVALAGCTTSSAGDVFASRSYAPTANIQLVDYGLPAQVAPLTVIRNEPGDLSQTLNRNYGLRPAARLSGPPTRMTSAEEDALIARAITEQEMRRP
jgi:hypothetical protein